MTVCYPRSRGRRDVTGRRVQPYPPTVLRERSAVEDAMGTDLAVGTAGADRPLDRLPNSASTWSPTRRGPASRRVRGRRAPGRITSGVCHGRLGRVSWGRWSITGPQRGRGPGIVNGGMATVHPRHWFGVSGHCLKDDGLVDIGPWTRLRTGRSGYPPLVAVVPIAKIYICTDWHYIDA